MAITCACQLTVKENVQLLKTNPVSTAKNRLLLAFSTLALILTLSVPTAWAEDDRITTITVYVFGASNAAPVAIQSQSVTGWVVVANWQGDLTDSTNLGVRFTRWAVDADQLGAGPFRAVLLSVDSSHILAASEPFYAPQQAGVNLAVTVGTPRVAVGQPALTVRLGKTIPQPPRQAAVLNATSSVETTTCHTGDCGWAQISVYLNGLPLNSWIAVEWQNGQGEWLPVPNWEGKADRFGLSPQVYKTWNVDQTLYSHGPFRWAVYSGADGGIIGVSPAFSLPTGDRQNLVIELTQ